MSGKYIFTGGYVATLDDSLGDFPCGAVLVEDGEIKAVGKVEDISSDGAEIIDCTDGVVIPGMIDTHRHVSMSLTRGIGGADMALFHFLSNTYMRWLPATSVEDMHLSALVGSLEAIDSGVTTIMDTCEAFHSPEHAEAELQGLKDSGIRAFFCYGMAQDKYGEVPTGRPAWEARLAHIKELRSTIQSSDALTQVAFQLSIIGTVPWKQTAEELRFADKEGLLCCSHSCGVVNSETTKDITVRADHDLLLPGHVYIHCTSLTAHELDLIAQSGGKVAIAMETDMQMGMGIPPIRDCTERGIRPSLSIDTSASVGPDLFSQMRLALQTQRMLDHHAAQKRGKVAMDMHYSARDALIWATRNGAEAVGLSDRIGTLTPGKRADIVLISDKRNLSASAHPLATAVLHSSPADVDTVMVDGNIRKRNGQLVEHHAEDIRERAKAGLQRIMAGLEGLRPEMTREEVEGYVAAVERLTRANLANAYAGEATETDCFRHEV